jgi:hypothetical protein
MLAGGRGERDEPVIFPDEYDQPDPEDGIPEKRYFPQPS